MFKATDNQTIITGINSVGLVSLLAYTLRTFNEVNNNIEELRTELDGLKKSHSDNNKRSNVAFNHLNGKLEENTRLLSNAMSSRPQIRKKTRVQQPLPAEEIVSEEEVEEIVEDTLQTTSFSNDEIRGALSELMGN